MSMVRCDECEILIDSDVDCDCFGKWGKAEMTLCERCRETLEIELEESA